MSTPEIEIMSVGDNIFWKFYIDGIGYSRGMRVEGRLESEEVALACVELLRKSAKKSVEEIPAIRQKIDEKRERIRQHLELVGG